MAEFGGSLVDESVAAEALWEEVEPSVPAGTTEGGIELEEFQPRPQSAERTPRPSVSLVHM